MAFVSQDWTSAASTSLDTDYLLSQMSNYAQIPTSFYPQPQQTYPHESPPISETSQKEYSDEASGGDDDENEDEDSHHKRKKAGSGAQGDAGKKGKTAAKGKKEPVLKKAKEPKDESKLSKRKEQNRAAQRAFRERKEKHVKDLEDKVGQLETKFEPLQKENETLKELLARLQKENVELKQAAFTFSLPKPELSPPASIHHKSQSPPTTFKPAPTHGGSPESFVSGSSTSNSNGNAHSNSFSSGHDSESESSASNNGNYGLRGFGPKVESPPALSFEGFNAFPNAQVGNSAGGSGSSGERGASQSYSNTQHRPAQQARDSSGSIESNPRQTYNPASYPNITYPNTQSSSHQPQPSTHSNSFSSPSPQQQQQQTLPPYEAPSPISFAFSPTNFFPASPVASTSVPSNNTYQTIASNPSFTSFRDFNAVSFDNFLDSIPSTGFDFDDPNLFSGALGQFDFDTDPSLAPFVQSSSLLSPTPTNDASIQAPASPFSTWLSNAAPPAIVKPDPTELATQYRTIYQDSHDQRLPWWDVKPANCPQGQVLLGADPKKENLQIPEVWHKIHESGYTSKLDSDALDVLCSEMKSKARCNGSGLVMDPDEVQDLIDELPHRFPCTQQQQQQSS